MYQTREYLERAENCAELAEEAETSPAARRFQRMEAAWRALAEEQRWLDGEVPPVRLVHSPVSHFSALQQPVRHSAGVCRDRPNADEIVRSTNGSTSNTSAPGHIRHS
ncbi:hypothetical protein SAMN05192541_117155 [Bradyrhizobium arachidis]|nr:hypothetical protein SAMN05192541_117155 [Bradyrhizobium arachidis]